MGQIVAEQRRKHGLSQEQLADRASVDQTAISRWENGVRGMTFAQFNRLLRVVGVTTAEFGRICEALSEELGAGC